MIKDILYELISVNCETKCNILSKIQKEDIKELNDHFTHINTPVLFKSTLQSFVIVGLKVDRDNYENSELLIFNSGYKDEDSYEKVINPKNKGVYWLHVGNAFK